MEEYVRRLARGEAVILPPEQDGREFMAYLLSVPELRDKYAWEITGTKEKQRFIFGKVEYMYPPARRRPPRMAESEGEEFFKNFRANYNQVDVDSSHSPFDFYMYLAWRLDLKEEWKLIRWEWQTTLKGGTICRFWLVD